MEKKEIEKEISYYLDWDSSVSLTQVKKDIEELEKLGATHINIEQGDFSYVTIEAIERRLETDEEFNQRKEEQELRQLAQKQEELKILAELKAKYENE